MKLTLLVTFCLILTANPLLAQEHEGKSSSAEKEKTTPDSGSKTLDKWAPQPPPLKME
jgi:hypothetical protein